MISLKKLLRVSRFVRAFTRDMHPSPILHDVLQLQRSGVLPTTGNANFPATLVDLGGLQYRSLTNLTTPQVYEAGAPNFNFSQVGTRSFADWNAVTYTDHVAILGFNSNANGGRENNALPAFQVVWESKFWSPGSRQQFAIEFGHRYFSTNGAEFRPFDSYNPYDGMGIQQTFVTDLFSVEQAVTRAGLKAQFMKMDLPRRQIIWFKSPLTGTATGATTNSAGYALGAESVVLAAAGSGSLAAGTVFQFDGVGDYYWVDTAVANVGVGGTLVFWPPLTQALSAAPHTIVRTEAGSPGHFFQSNNVAVMAQRNAADSGYLSLPYIGASNRVVNPTGWAPNGTGSPMVFVGLSGMATSTFAFTDDLGNSNFSVGGIAGNTSGVGRGWVKVENTLDTSSGIEINYHPAGAQAACTLQTDNSGSTWLRQINTGTLATTGSLIIAANSATQAIKLRTYPFTDRVSITETLATFSALVKLPAFANLAALNAVMTAATAGAGTIAKLDASTTPGGACLVVSDGAVWKVLLALGSATTVV